jgi:integrase
MPQLYKQPKSPFWFYDFTVNGVRARGSTKQTVKYKAQLVLDGKKQKARMSGVESLTRKVPTLAEFMPTFLERIKLSEKLMDSTKRFYACGVDLLKACALAGMKLDAINDFACETIKFPGSNNYNANKALRTLRKILTVAQGFKLLSGTLPKITMRPVVGRSVAMSRADADLIAANMPAGHAKDCFMILRGTGMRPSEAMCMRWEYMQWSTGIYANPNGKTKSAKRPVPLLNGSLDVLRRRHMQQGFPVSGWVFPAKAKTSKTGHLVTITKAFKEAREKAGLPAAMCIYTARHGALTDLGAVVSTAELMLYGGHSKAQTAMIYQHPQTAMNLQALLDASPRMIATGLVN